MRHLLLPLLLVLLCSARPVLAQETQVPLDESGSLMVIDASVDEAEELFPDFPGFREARLFRVSEDAYVLEVLYESGGEVVRERRSLTPEEVSLLRARVTSALPVSAASATRPDQRGRAMLLGQATVASLVLYGPALPVVLDVDSEEAVSALYLATTSAGFFIPFFATKNAPVTRGAARLSLAGTLHGALHGLGLSLLVSGVDANEQSIVGLMALGSAAEAVAGYYYATAYNTSRGTAETMSAVATYGTIFGLSAGGVFSVAPDDDFDNDPFYDDEDFFDDNIRIFGGAALIGSLAGAYAGHSLARTEPYTSGDARVLAAAAMLGVNLGILAIDLSDTRNGRVGSGFIAAGTVAGLAAGRLLTTRRDFSASEGSYIGLASWAGGLAALSVASMVDASATASYTIGTIGSLAGFGLMYAAYQGGARRASTEDPRADVLDVHVNPVGLLGAVRGRAPEGTGVFSIRVRM